MSRPYTGTKDAVHAKKRAGTVAVYDYLRFLFGLTGKGVFADRDIRTQEGIKSVHSTYRAMDLGGSATTRRRGIEFVYKHRTALGVEAIHDYRGDFLPNPKGYGAGYRCDRDNGGLLAGWKVYTKPTIGSPNATWFHLELSPETADKTREQIDGIFKEILA